MEPSWFKSKCFFLPKNAKFQLTEQPLATSVRRVALTRLYTRLPAAAGDPPDTNIVLGDYQATSENLAELNGGKPAKTETKKEIHFPNLSLILSYLR